MIGVVDGQMIGLVDMTFPKLTPNNEVIIHLPKDKLYTKQEMDNAYDKGFKDGQDTER